jgi:hypothetical protein
MGCPAFLRLDGGSGRILTHGRREPSRAFEVSGSHGRPVPPLTGMCATPCAASCSSVASRSCLANDKARWAAAWFAAVTVRPRRGGLDSTIAWRELVVLVRRDIQSGTSVPPWTLASFWICRVDRRADRESIAGRDFAAFTAFYHQLPPNLASIPILPILFGKGNVAEMQTLAQ